MDRTQVCGTCNPGSIPGESTNERAPSGAFSFVLERRHSLRPRIEKVEYIARSGAMKNILNGY